MMVYFRLYRLTSGFRTISKKAYSKTEQAFYKLFLFQLYLVNCSSIKPPKAMYSS